MVVRALQSVRVRHDFREAMVVIFFETPKVYTEKSMIGPDSVADWQQLRIMQALVPFLCVNSLPYHQILLRKGPFLR